MKNEKVNYKGCIHFFINNKKGLISQPRNIIM